MTKGSKHASMMRSASLSTDALLGNFSSLVASHGADAVVDLRGDAFGCGVDRVAEIARAAGLRRAFYGFGPHSKALSASTSDDSHAHTWWSGPGGEVIEFSADVISLKRVPAGSSVSYGYHYTTTNETTLALVCAGYADGVPRTASGSGQIFLSGNLYPIAGRIAMDQLVVDVGNHSHEVGDRATIWGSAPTLAQWSKWSGRPQQALMSHIGSRVVKQWI
jgi:alanine racemase